MARARYPISHLLARVVGRHFVCDSHRDLDSPPTVTAVHAGCAEHAERPAQREALATIRAAQHDVGILAALSGDSIYAIGSGVRLRRCVVVAVSRRTEMGFNLPSDVISSRPDR